MFEDLEGEFAYLGFSLAFSGFWIPVYPLRNLGWVQGYKNPFQSFKIKMS